MIKVNCKNGECKIKVDGACDEILSECAYLMIAIIKKIKRNDVSMRKALSDLANMAADIHEGREKEYCEKEE